MPYYDPVAYKVVQRKGNMITAERTGHKVTRNSSFFKKVPEEGDDELSSDELPPNIDDPITTNEQGGQSGDSNEGLRRSTRVTGAPVRFPMDVPY